MDLRAGEIHNKLASKDRTSAAKNSFPCLCRPYLLLQFRQLMLMDLRGYHDMELEQH
jgi:hypothetical protein